MNAKATPPHEQEQLEALRRQVAELQAACEASRQTIESLRERRRRYRSYFELAPYGVFVVDGNGRYRRVNQAACQMTGYSKEEFLKMSVQDFLAPEYLEGGLKGFAHFLETGTRSAETLCTKKDGTRIYMTLDAVKIAEDRFIGYCRDITRRKQVLEELRITNSAIECSINAIAFADLHNNLTYVNRSFLEFWGYDDKKEVLGQPSISFWETPEKAQEVIAKRNADGRWTGELTAKRKDGSTFDVHLSASTVTDESGQPIGSMGSFIDITERKRTEAALAENRTWMELILQNSSDGINLCELDLKTGKRRLLMCNDRYVEMSGRSREELMAADNLNRFGRELTVAEQKRPQEEQKRKCLPYRGLSSWARPDGKENYYEWTAAPIDVGDKRLIIGIDRDVTEHRRMEEALTVANARLQYLLRSSPGVIYTAKPSGNYAGTFISENVKDQLGYEAREFTENPDFWASRIHPDDAPRVLSELAAAEGQGHYAHEYRFRHKDGSYRWMRDELTVVRGQDGHALECVGFWIDITDRKEAEQALRESEERYRDLFENAPLCIFEEDLTQTPPVILRVNRRTEETFGWAFEEHGPIPVERMIPPEARETFQRVRKALKIGKTVRLESLNMRHDGSVFPVRLSATVSPTAGFKRAIVMIEDITERKRAEEALQAAHRKLMNAREHERRHLAGELHDSVAQSLVAMKLQLQNASVAAEARDARTLTAAIATAGEVCDQLVGEVRQMCHGLYPPALESLGLLAALRQLAGYHQQKKLVTIRPRGKIRTARFPADVEIALLRIAQDAVNNAVRHSQAEHVDVYLSHKKGQLTLLVVDDGTGFDAEAAVGQGLGLSTMKERAAAVGGDFQITSQPGRTCVEVTVPVEPIPSSGQ